MALSVRASSPVAGPDPFPHPAGMRWCPTGLRRETNGGTVSASSCSKFQERPEWCTHFNPSISYKSSLNSFFVVVVLLLLLLFLFLKKNIMVLVYAFAV